MISEPRWWHAFRSLAMPLAGVVTRNADPLADIHHHAAALADVPLCELADHADELRGRVRAGCSPTAAAVVGPGFALVREAFRRLLGIQLYDVQLLAGLALVRPAVAEMQTGEGKTFAAVLPAFVHALAGRGVHVMTVNAYLAERDFEQLEPVYRTLGLSAGLVRSDATPADKRAAYACDVTYGPGYEFGFDYLRDQSQLLARRHEPLGDEFRRQLRGEAPPDHGVQRGHAVAIVDEIDSVLLDEATTPLVLARGSQSPASAENAAVYKAALVAARRLTAGVDFVDTGLPKAHLTRHGIAILQSQTDDIPRQGLQRPWRDYVEAALQADLRFRRDVEYIVRDDQILLVDQHTGRIFADRSWQDGLHQAVQAKEGITITCEQEVVARITRQRFFRRYDILCGMTGTAATSGRELKAVFGLPVESIATHRRCQRREVPARHFADRASKRAAIAEDVAARHRRGQPVLVGTQTIEESEMMSTLLVLRNVPHLVLNGKQDQEEATIVGRAGLRGAVTIATNMAGRGTDIPLGPGVPALGGLHVIVCEPHESARVDRQLIGRAARQGDPGSYQRFASAEDPTIVLFAPRLVEPMRRTADNQGECSGELQSEIQRVQRQVERLRFQQRQQMYAHDDWLENMLRDFAS